MFADVIVDITHEKLDKVFQYRVPERLAARLEVGSRVLIPFGQGNKQIAGYIVGFSRTAEVAESRIKEIAALPETGIAIEERLVKLAAWLKEYYGGTMIAALKTVLPVKKKENIKERRYVSLAISPAAARQRLSQYLDKNQRARARLVATLLDQKNVDTATLAREQKITAAVLKPLQEQGVITVKAQRVYRDPLAAAAAPDPELALNAEQQQAVRRFTADYDQGERKTYLIHGITGSGKTEVYMEMIDHVVRQGRQAIMLIPEIALTYQTALRFYRKFGERVAIINSRLSFGERFDALDRVRNHEVDVIIGPRSALFAPFEKLGLIVIDEEHESTYKSEQVPRYHARETAIKRAELEDASVVLGSATPALESYYKCEQGEYELLELRERATCGELPAVEIVDLKAELKSGNRSILSRRLQELMSERLAKRQQMMLFLNRRGYAGFISCRSCGYVVKCPHCDVSLSVHRGGRLVCHYCGYEQPPVTKCPDCGSPFIGGFKAGTQQVEELLKKEFPTARVLRMDLDTTRAKHGYEKILKAFARREADILIGTQMIVKGHDFPGVTLVGILAADMSLYANDYRAAERTFQLLTQAAGRAGRGEAAGQVVIQTYSPEHPAILRARDQDYEGFYTEEMAYRRLLGYPPAANLLAVLLTGGGDAQLEVAAKYLKEFAARVDRRGEFQIIGPTVPFVAKVKDIYRRVIYLKCEDYQALIRAKNKMEQYIDVNKGFEALRVQFDFNPLQVF